MKSFDVKDKVFHPNIGAGYITKIVMESFGDSEIECFEVISYFRKGKVLVPVNNLDNTGLRKVVKKTELARALKIISSSGRPLKSDYKQRYKLLLGKFKKGDILKFAEVIRDLKSAVRDDAISISEKKLFEKSFDLLAGECAVVKDIDMSDATELVDKTLFKRRKKKRSKKKGVKRQK